MGALESQFFLAADHTPDCAKYIIVCKVMYICSV
jgi:hypothetical protein